MERRHSVLITSIVLLFLFAAGLTTFALIRALQVVPQIGETGTGEIFAGAGTLDNPVEYSAATHGTTCPLNTYFKKSRRAATIGCMCPAGYTFDSTMIGGETGDACYGPGTECPIFSSVCTKN